MNKLVNLSVRDNRKSDFTEKPKAFAFSTVFKYFYLKFSEPMYNSSGNVSIGPDLVLISKYGHMVFGSYLSHFMFNLDEILYTSSGDH